MQLSFLKTLFIIGTLAGVAMAQGNYGKRYHHKGGVIKRTILIDGCTGKPVEKAYNEGGLVEDDMFEPPTKPPFEEPPAYDDDMYSLDDEYRGEDEGYYHGRDDIYRARDEIVDDYNYLGGGDITDDELII